MIVARYKGFNIRNSTNSSKINSNSKVLLHTSIKVSPLLTIDNGIITERKKFKNVTEAKNFIDSVLKFI